MPPWPSAFPYLYHFSIIVNHHTKNAYLTTRRKHIIHTSESMSHCLITVQKGKFLHTVINKKPHLCGGVRQSRLCERSGASTISIPRSEHLIITPLQVHHFLLRSLLTDIRNTALRLKYFTTWSYKNTYLSALSVRHRVTYITAHFAAVSKRNVHWVALKHRLNMWTLAHFYYVDIGTYCCVFIMLLQKRIVAVQNSNIWGLSLKVNALLCWKYALHQTQP